MHGHGPAHPVKQPPPVAWLVFLRVLFVVVSVFSIGFLAWGMMLRLAIVTRRSLDWGLFVAVLAADVLSVVLIAAEPGDEIHTPGGWTGLCLLLGALVAGIAYYLAADVRYFQQLRYAAWAPGPAYGYPQGGAAPYTAAPPPPHGAPSHTPPPPVAAPHTPPPAYGQAPYSSVPRSTPPPRRPEPARLDQVRAELDELSDYLRRHEGRPDGGPDGSNGSNGGSGSGR